MLADIPHMLIFEGANAAMVAAALLPGVKENEAVARPVEEIC
jgi:hypothetical protein